MTVPVLTFFQQQKRRRQNLTKSIIWRGCCPTSAIGCWPAISTHRQISRLHF